MASTLGLKKTRFRIDSTNPTIQFKKWLWLKKCHVLVEDGDEGKLELKIYYFKWRAAEE